MAAFLLVLTACFIGPAMSGGSRSAASVASTAVCDAPTGLVSDDTALPHLRAALAGGGPVGVLAVGSGTMDGADGGFPASMARALRESGRDIRLTTRSSRGWTAAEMLAIMQAELAGQRYALVVWQTGTVEAVRKMPAEAFGRVLADGAAAAAAAAVDLVLVDPQYSRMLLERADIAPYQAIMQRAADLPDVAIFHRYALTRFWVTSGRIDLENAAKGAHEQASELLHDCLGQALAALVLKGVRAP